MNFTDNVKHKPTLQPHSSSSILALTMAALIALSAVTTSPALAGGDTGGGTDVGNGGLKLECEAPEQTLDGLFIDAYLIDKERHPENEAWLTAEPEFSKLSLHAHLARIVDRIAKFDLKLSVFYRTEFDFILNALAMKKSLTNGSQSIVFENLKDTRLTDTGYVTYPRACHLKQFSMITIPQSYAPPYHDDEKRYYNEYRSTIQYHFDESVLAATDIESGKMAFTLAYAITHEVTYKAAYLSVTSIVAYPNVGSFSILRPRETKRIQFSDGIRWFNNYLHSTEFGNSDEYLKYARFSEILPYVFLPTSPTALEKFKREVADTITTRESQDPKTLPLTTYDEVGGLALFTVRTTNDGLHLVTTYTIGEQEPTSDLNLALRQLYEELAMGAAHYSY